MDRTGDCLRAPRQRSPMNRQQFESTVHAVVRDLPVWVREALDNIEILVEEAPEAELDPEGSGLLGIYLGTPLPQRGVHYAWALPDVIYIFRQPHLDLNLPDEELRQEIARTVIHEIAHYFGIDDDHLDKIGWG